MSERVLPPFVLSSCTARHGAGPRSQGKKVSKRPRKPDGRAPGSVREPGGLRLRLAQPSYLPGPSRWRWQCGPRARDHVACRWLHRPVFFSLACRHRRRVSTHGPPCRLLERSAEARGLVTRNGRGTVDCEKPVHETTSISINPYTDAILNSHPSLSSFGSHMDFTRYTL